MRWRSSLGRRIGGASSWASPFDNSACSGDIKVEVRLRFSLMPLSSRVGLHSLNG